MAAGRCGRDSARAAVWSRDRQRLRRRCPCSGRPAVWTRARRARVRRRGSPRTPRATSPWCPGLPCFRDLAVTSYTPTGTLRWRSTVSPSIGVFIGDWVAAAANGDVVAVGHNVTSSGSPIGLTLVRFGSDGRLQWRVDLAAHGAGGGAAAGRSRGKRLPRVQLGGEPPGDRVATSTAPRARCFGRGSCRPALANESHVAGVEPGRGGRRRDGGRAPAAPPGSLPPTTPRPAPGGGW